MSRAIPEIYWQKAFWGPEGKYDGKKFESLAFRILERLHGNGWKRTQSSHDGSRDFEKRDLRGQLWAECKAYSQHLPIYVLSPTLVMALIEDPHTVIIFSRSNLNANAIKHLAAYQATASKTIIAYDGTVLDHAILATNIYPDFFPHLPNPIPAEPSIQVRWSLTNDVLTEASEMDFRQYSHINTATRSIDTVRYGLVRLDLALKNLGPVTNSKIKLQLLDETLNSNLRIITFNRQKYAKITFLQIPPAGIAQVSLIVQPQQASDSLPFPKLRIIAPGAPKAPLELGTLHVSQLYQIDVVGTIHRAILAKTERFLHNRRRSVVIAIEGASGTGKSRLLQETIRIGLEEGFRCHFYDPEFEDPKAADHVIRRLIADLSELPLMPESADKASMESVSPNGQQSILARILYDETFPVWKHITEVVTTILFLLQKAKNLLVIDNIQFTNDNFIELIDLLLARLHHTRERRVAIILAFNTDFDRPGSKSSMLLARLRALSAESNRASTVFHARLEDFTTDDVAEFLQAVFSGNRGRDIARLYSKTLELLTKHVQPRPLNLWQSLMYLCDFNILSLEGDRLKVGDNKSLLEQIDNLPRKLEDLLALRWSRICQNEARSGIPADELDAAVRIVYFMGTDKVDRILDIGGSRRALNRLLYVGILATGSSGRIQFFHNQVFAFFRKLFASVDKTIAMELKESFAAKSLTKIKFQQYFILCHFAAAVNNSIIAATIHHLQQSGLTADYWQQYTDLLWTYLLASRSALSATAVMGAALISQWQEKMQSLQRGAASIQQFLALEVLKKSRHKIPGEKLFYFYTAAANACLAIYDDPAALEVINLALSDIQISKFSNKAEKKNALGMILNRQTATLKNFGRVEEALNAGKLALQSFRETENRSMEVETLFDMASILLSLPERRAEGWQLLRDGCSIFKRNQADMREAALSRYYFVSAELSLHAGYFNDVYHTCAEGVRHTERIRSHFWGIRILLLEVVARLLAATDSRSELGTANALLIRARDWANISEAERARWGLAYLDGKLLARSGNKAGASKAFSEAVASLAGRLRTPEQVAWRSSLFLDIAATCRRNNLALGDRSINLLASASIQCEMMEILQMPDEIFALFDKSRISKALFSRGKEVVELI